MQVPQLLACVLSTLFCDLIFLYSHADGPSFAAVGSLYPELSCELDLQGKVDSGKAAGLTLRSIRSSSNVSMTQTFPLC